jgi:hypothetical protein
MADPLSLIAISAAVGGGAGKFVEKAWDSSEKWITSYFADHRPKAIIQAQTNSAEFLNDLAKRIKTLEDSGVVSKQDIESAQEQPDFSIALQKAILVAAQTGNKQKHHLLARAVTERLAANPEGLRAMASRMALDVIGYMTPNQLKLLALSVELLYVKPTSALSKLQFEHWFATRYLPYESLSFTNLDMLHLESISCLKYTPFISRELVTTLSQKCSETLDSEFLSPALGQHIQEMWDLGLESVELTSVGQLVGVYVSDLMTGENTSFSDWG